MKNELARELSLAEGKIQYDNSVKRVLANKRILAWILKYEESKKALSRGRSGFYGYRLKRSWRKACHFQRLRML